MKRSRKRYVRFGLLAANLVLLLGIVVFISESSSVGPNSARNAILGDSTVAVINPLDQLSSADIAVHISRMAQFNEATSVTNKADTISAQLAVGVADEIVVAKPQIVATDSKSKYDIITHVVAADETIASIAEKYGITSDSVRWSNNLTSNYVTVGKELVIPPVSGIAYVVKSGDTPDSLATKYRANKSKIIAINDAEVSGLVEGERIIIPDAAQPAVRSTTSYSAGFAWGGGSAVYGYNGYDYGYCTWWVAIRRIQSGRPMPANLGNAISWYGRGQRAGLGVGRTPALHAIIWTYATYGYGHVGFVERIDADGGIWVSDMNASGVDSIGGSQRAGGWNRVSYRYLDPAKAAAAYYVY